MDRIRKGGFGKEEDETVYVTETGLVYHKDYHCTYLDLSIRMVQGKEISGLRNESGGRYYACEHCGEKAEDRPILPITATAITVLFPAAA